MPPNGKPARIASSLQKYDDVASEDNKGYKPASTNPTVVPDQMLRKFHFTFLIRHPKWSIPSYYRCTVPPLSDITGFDHFDPSEAGYKELRALFDYLKETGHIGPKKAKGNGQAPETWNQKTTSHGNGKMEIEICVIDADDLLDNPYQMIEAYCSSVGLKYAPEMLKWGDNESQRYAERAFGKWKGFHEDALSSEELQPRAHKKTPKSEEELYQEWAGKFGTQGANIIKQTVDENVSDYEHLKQFALRL